MYYDYNDNGSANQMELKRNRLVLEKKPMPTINSGGAILIVIFVALCLTVFGFLSFTTSFADKKLTDKSIKNSAEYYAACAKAEAELFDLYSHVPEVNGKFDGYVYYPIQVEINDIQSLFCAVYFYYDENDILQYEIDQWYVMLTAEFDYDTNKLDVWQGEERTE